MNITMGMVWDYDSEHVAGFVTSVRGSKHIKVSAKLYWLKYQYLCCAYDFTYVKLSKSTQLLCLCRTQAFEIQKNSVSDYDQANQLWKLVAQAQDA